jgi:hypothetical protein
MGPIKAVGGELNEVLAAIETRCARAISSVSSGRT